MSSDIFLAYSNQDQEIAQRFRDDLQAIGLSVWSGSSSDDEEAIRLLSAQKAIESAHLMVVLLSPDAKESKWVYREILLAQQLGKPVLPVVVRGRDAVPLALADHHYLDARFSYSDALRRLARAIYKELGKTPDGSTLPYDPEVDRLLQAYEYPALSWQDRFLRVMAILLLVISIFWFIANPLSESLIVLLVSIVIAFMSFSGLSQRDQLRTYATTKIRAEKTQINAEIDRQINEALNKRA